VLLPYLTVCVFGAKALTGEEDASVQIQLEKRNTSPATM